jgi:signal peptidase II
MTMVVIVLLDQVSKMTVLAYFPQIGSGRVLIPYLINLLHVQNAGAAWGMLQGRQVLLISCAVAALVWMVFSMRRTFLQLPFGWLTWGLLSGGIIGNLIDRVWRRIVIDFIDLNFINFPTFNIADAAISIGVVILIITQWLHDRTTARDHTKC